MSYYLKPPLFLNDQYQLIQIDLQLVPLLAMIRVLGILQGLDLKLNLILLSEQPLEQFKINIIR
jgi:hypothetical protein